MEKLSMRKIKEVLRLRLEFKRSYRVIARSLNIGETTAREYIIRADKAKIVWPLSKDIEEEQLTALLYPPKGPRRRDQLAPDFPTIHKELRRKGVTLVLLWEEYLQSYPQGYSYSHFASLYEKWRSCSDTWMPQQHKAGESLFVDYAGMTIPVYNPQTGNISFNAQIFVSSLGASAYTYCRAFKSQQLDEWIAAHKSMFAFYGGVPQSLVPDNLKSGVTTADRYDPELNITYYEMANHYGTVILPARSRKPKDKAKVENAVLNVERTILAPLRHRKFFHLRELNQALEEQCTKLNNKPFQKMPGSTRHSLFLELDKPALKQLPQTDYELFYWSKKVLDGSYHAEVDGSRYSVPFKLIKKEIEVRYNERTVEIFYKGKQEAIHIKNHQKGSLITNPQHRPPNHQHHANCTPEKIREEAKTIGEKTLEWVEHVLTDTALHHHQQIRISLGVVRLSKIYPPSRIEAACTRGLHYKNFSSRSIRDMLARNLDQQALPKKEELPHLPQQHTNLRDTKYYA